MASTRGPRGGYRLLHATRHATLADLMDSLEEPMRLAACNQPQPEACCSLTASCPIRDPIAAVHNRLRAVLENVTLAELFGSPTEVAVPLELTRI